MKKRLFGDFLRNIAELKVLNVLLHDFERSFNLSELSREAGISWSTLHRVFPRFLEEGFVVREKDVGRAKLYKLNKANESAINLVKAHNSFIIENHHEFINEVLRRHV